MSNAIFEATTNGMRVTSGATGKRYTVRDSITRNCIGMVEEYVSTVTAGNGREVFRAVSYHSADDARSRALAVAFAGISK